MNAFAIVCCIINVKYCPSCKHYGPINSLSPSEPRHRYTLVDDKDCRQFYCKRTLLVFTPWVPDPGTPKDQDWQSSCCEHCLPADCHIQVFYRDCCSLLKDSRWFLRKTLNEGWTNNFFSLARVEKMCVAERWLSQQPPKRDKLPFL